MSLEVYGDEGHVPANWEDTAMRQEFDEIRARYNKWIMTFKGDVPSPELDAQIEKAEDAFDKLSILMEGDL